MVYRNYKCVVSKASVSPVSVFHPIHARINGSCPAPGTLIVIIRDRLKVWV